VKPLLLFAPLNLNSDCCFVAAAAFAVNATGTLPLADISVTNLAYNAAGDLLGPLNSLCAKIANEDFGQLKVAPCFLPTALAGPYWVLAYSESEGYALVSGGPPNNEGADGGCKTGTGTNDSGLWIFTRERNPPSELVDRVRGIAKAKGFDLSVLVTIDQSNCTNAQQPAKDSAAAR
jgi:lipocalin